MWGEPEDVEGQCNARLFVADTWGDNHATMRCQKAPGHKGLHRELYGQPGARVAVHWEKDAREHCEHCGAIVADHKASDCYGCHVGHDVTQCALCLKEPCPHCKRALRLCLDYAPHPCAINAPGHDYDTCVLCNPPDE